MKKAIIHVNRQNLAMNAKDGKSRPVFTMKQEGKTTYARGVDIEGNVKLVSPVGGQLNCGARAWIEVEEDAKVELEEPMSFKESRNF